MICAVGMVCEVVLAAASRPYSPPLVLRGLEGIISPAIMFCCLGAEDCADMGTYGATKVGC